MDKKFEDPSIVLEILFLVHLTIYIKESHYPY